MSHPVLSETADPSAGGAGQAQSTARRTEPVHPSAPGQLRHHSTQYPRPKAWAVGSWERSKGQGTREGDSAALLKGTQRDSENTLSNSFISPRALINCYVQWLQREDTGSQSSFQTCNTQNLPEEGDSSKIITSTRYSKASEEICLPLYLTLRWIFGIWLGQ